MAENPYVDQLSKIEKREVAGTLNLPLKVIEGLSGIFKKQFEADQSFLQENALASYAEGLEYIRHQADIHPKDGVEYIEEQSDRLIKEIDSAFGGLSENFYAKANTYLTHQKIRFLAQERSVIKPVSIGNGIEATARLADNAHSIPHESLSKSFDDISGTLGRTYGSDVGEMVAYNAYGIATLNLGSNQPMEQPPVIPNSNAYTQLNTHLDTDLRFLQEKNPILAREFLRIRDLTNAQASQLSSEIRSQYPDSPEPAAIDTALNLRARALQTNPLSFAAKQKYVKIISNPEDLFKGEKDSRFEAVRSTLDFFGTTSFFTEQERTLLKESPDNGKVRLMSLNMEKLNAFNAKNVGKTQIPPSFLAKEFREIDPDAYSWSQLISDFPDLRIIPLSEIKNFDPKNIDLEKKDSILPQVAQGVADISTAYKQLVVADYIKFGENNTSNFFGGKSSNYSFEHFFHIKETYFYAPTYKYGAFFEDSANAALNIKEGFPKIFLKNTGINMYRAYTKAGVPYLTQNGETVEFNASFLNDYASTVIGRK